MTDLTFCYRHMTQDELFLLNTVEDGEYSDGNLSDEDLNIPSHMIPPNPEDADTLPSQQHPSYPYGDPTRMGHPAKFIRPSNVYNPASHMRFTDAAFHTAARPESSLQWPDLALELLLPHDQDKIEAERAAQARKLASGAGAGGAGGGQRPPPQQQPQHNAHAGPPPVVVAPVPLPMDDDDEAEDDEDDEDEHDENDGSIAYGHHDEGDMDEDDDDGEGEVDDMMGEGDNSDEEYDDDVENDENEPYQQTWQPQAFQAAQHRPPPPS
ncbi:hypothetical protein BKA62DRAFT_809254 [Auriculariales sp. MPI-PUGE-AT-0066]|nr:hypothetical protein BKA62DRAFT_809254 [Auriculariales sp. MPI-PUGE-AT-0066]